MADTKTTALSAFTPVLTDLGYGVDDPGGTPISGKFTFADVRTLLQANLTTATITVAAANTAALASTGYSLTGADATSMINLTGTWNTTGTPTAINAFITDTASNTASLLMDLGNTNSPSGSRFTVDKWGHVTIWNAGAGAGQPFRLFHNGSEIFTITSIGGLQWVGDGGTAPSLNFQGLAGTNIKILKDSIQWGTDLYLYRDAAGILAQRNGTTGQENRVWNTWTDASNGEYGGFKWNTNVLEIGSVALGTGTLRGIQLGVTSNAIGFMGATPIVRFTTTGTVTGFTAGSGTAANDDSTFTGNSGTAAYTVGDIVLALKNYGLLAAS